MRSAPLLDRVASWFGGVLASGGCGPGEGPVEVLVHFPFRVLLEPVVMPALRAPVTYTGSAACLVRDVMVEIASCRGPPAGRGGACGVPDLRQVAQHDARIVTRCLISMVTILGGERPDADDERALAGRSGVQPPGPVAAG